MQTKSLKAGDYAFRQGDHSDVAYVIESGKVEIVKENPGPAIALVVFEKGEIFGEMGLVDEKPRSAAARAMIDTELTVIDRNEFVELLLSDPKRSIIFIRAIFERLRHMNSLINGDIHELMERGVGRDKHLVVLLPLTDRAALEVPKAGLKIEKFPYRIGRQSIDNERSTLDMNDLVLNDTAPFNVSKNHISIELVGSDLIVNDRGSYFGTLVNGTRIGGQRLTGKAILTTGENKIIFGNNGSLFQFTLTVH